MKIFVLNLPFEDKFEIETINALDQNSNIQFLRNEFSKISHDLFTMTLLTATIHINDKTLNQKLKLKTAGYRW